MSFPKTATARIAEVTKKPKTVIDREGAKETTITSNSNVMAAEKIFRFLRKLKHAATNSQKQ